MKICRKCNKPLSSNNCCKSFLEQHTNPLCRVCANQERRILYERYRREIICILGGKCEFCDEKEYQLLSIDHIDGGGRQERIKIRGKQYLRHILKMENPGSKYRILCYNCNYALGFWKVNAYAFEKTR